MGCEGEGTGDAAEEMVLYIGGFAYYLSHEN